MLRIHIAGFTEGESTLDERVEACALSQLKAVAGEGAIRFVKPVHARIHATLAGETVLIDGAVTTAIRIPCSRCLEPFELDLETHFSTTAMPEIPAAADSDIADAVELTADDIEVIAYSGESIDLGNEIAQQIVMALPFKPLCRETCKGLCSRCGADLNQRPCRCHQQKPDSPFAVLKTFSFPEDKE